MKAERQIAQLLQETSGREAARKPLIQYLLADGFGFDVVPEYSVESGVVDLYLPARRVVIEVKGSRKLSDPRRNNTGSAVNESAYEQLCRYVRDERERERERLNIDAISNEVNWLGVVTDGKVWWIWEWEHTADAPTPLQQYQPYRADNSEAIRHVVRNFDRVAGKRWAPPDPTELFRTELKSLSEHYEAVSGLKSTQTQQTLWFRQLEISGCAPEQTDLVDLFIIHTLLIAVARTIAELVGNQPEDRTGFVAWSNEGEQGEMWWKGIKAKVEEYDWVAPQSDVLRPLFSGYIEQKHRKVFGEYFTPDWLAERLVKEIIDDSWIRKQLRHLNDKGPIKNVGVLDPACGSGTFLFHAIRRILDSAPVEEEALTPQQKANFAVRLVCGIDIHPVAVEMARASILRALPAAPYPESIQVIQGDSLLIERSEMLSSIEKLEIVSRDGKRLRVPFTFAQCPSFDDDLQKIVETANAKTSIPPHVLLNKGQEMQAELKTLHSVLSKVCAVEGNSVWAWHIRHRIAPHILKERKVDRIVTNPPWVSLRGIQNIARKSEILELAKKNHLWIGGGIATTFNVGALFVSQCSNLYLADDSRSAWVLPDAALNGENWEKFRSRHDPHTEQIWDVGKLPFPKQSAACVRIHRNANDRNNDISYLELVLKEDSRQSNINAHDSWARVERHLKFEESQRTTFNHLGSEWMDANDLKPKQGATLSPFCLLRVGKYTLHRKNYKIQTLASRQDPWKTLHSQHGEIPMHWLLDAIYNTDLFPYFVAEPCSRIVAPVNQELSAFEDDPSFNAYWKKANEFYENLCGQGTTTPKTLLDQIDYHGKFSSQLKRVHTSMESLVIHNNSGAHLCAARTKSTPIVNNDIIWLLTDSISEAKFLVGLLNSDALIPAIKSTKTDTRHYSLNVWKNIPIPRFNPTSSAHRELSDVVSIAETEARDLFRDFGDNATSPIKGRKIIREGLRESGLSAEIDNIVARILPDFVR